MSNLWRRVLAAVGGEPTGDLRRADVVAGYASADLSGLASYEVISRLEVTFDVNALRADGHPIWPLVRGQLVVLYSYARDNLDSAHAKRGPGDDGKPSEASSIDRQRAAAKREAAWQRIQESGDLARAELLFFSRTARRDSLIDGKRYNQALDPCIRLAEGRHGWIKIEFDRGGQETTAPGWFRSAVLDPARFIRAARAGRPSPVIQGLRELEARLPAIDGRPPRIGQKIESFYPRLCAYEELFGRILEQVRPSAVFHVGHSIEDLALNRACRSLGITTVDLQHGAAALMSRNIKWLGWRNAPPEGYDLVADLFWVWGQRAADNINASMPPDRRTHWPVVGGNLWLSEWLVPGPDGPWTREDLEPGLRARIEAAGRTILVTLANMTVTAPPAHLIEAIRQAPDDWLWLIRLHPLDLDRARWAAELRQRLDPREPNIEIEAASRALLPALLRRADHHVTLYSSVAFEALAFGVPTTLVHEAARPYFAEYLDEGVFDLALDAPALARALRGSKTARAESVITADPEIARQALDKVLAFRSSVG